MSLIDPVQFVPDDHRRRLSTVQRWTAPEQPRTRRAARRAHRQCAAHA